MPAEELPPLPAAAAARVPDLPAQRLPRDEADDPWTRLAPWSRAFAANA